MKALFSKSFWLAETCCHRTSTATAMKFRSWSARPTIWGHSCSMTLLVFYPTEEYTEVPQRQCHSLKRSPSVNKSLKIKSCLCFFSHGISNLRGNAGHASDMEQLQSASQRQNQANAVERHVWHSSQMEEVRNTQNKKDFVPNLYEITQIKFMEAPLCLTSVFPLEKSGIMQRL